MLVVPRNHHEHLTEASPKDLVATGKSIRNALARLRDVTGDPAYNIVFHTAPHNHPGAYHWHVHITPRLTSVAGFEQGTGVMINIMPPELACTQLKSASV
jgi:UDPglucose--hexose-1-phosphate uridylyltransferase